MNKIFATLVLTSILLVPTIMSAYAYSGSGTATGSVSIAGTCGIGLSSSTISYGTASYGSTPVPASNTVGINNTGSVPSTLFITGADWLSGTSVSEILASNTQVSLTGAAPWTSLATTAVQVGATNGFVVTPHGTSYTSTWQLIPQLENLGFTGSLTQQLSFATSC